MARLQLRELAESRGLNMSQVQRQTGLSMGQVRRYWYNDTTLVALDALSALAKLLNVTPGDLLTAEPAPQDDGEAHTGVGRPARPYKPNIVRRQPRAKRVNALHEHR
jgi:transcriptional regulator with XRE-family HTH domain